MRLDGLRRDCFVALAFLLNCFGWVFSTSSNLFLAPAGWCKAGAAWCDARAKLPPRVSEGRAQ
jgi:hypothetical protein